jgi:hypothetical protein
MFDVMFLIGADDVSDVRNGGSNVTGDDID